AKALHTTPLRSFRPSRFQFEPSSPSAASKSGDKGTDTSAEGALPGRTSGLRNALAWVSLEATLALSNTRRAIPQHHSKRCNPAPIQGQAQGGSEGSPLRQSASWRPYF